MPGLDFCYEIIIMFSRTHTVFVCEKIIYLNNSVYVWQNYLFKIETWIIRARKMDLSFVVIDRQIVDRRVDLCFIRVHLTVSSFQSSFSSHTIPPSGPGTSLSVHSCPGIFFYNFRALENSHFVKADPGTSFFQFFRALEPPSPRIQGSQNILLCITPLFLLHKSTVTFIKKLLKSKLSIFIQRTKIMISQQFLLCSVKAYRVPLGIRDVTEHVDRVKSIDTTQTFNLRWVIKFTRNLLLCYIMCNFLLLNSRTIFFFLKKYHLNIQEI